MSKLYTWSAEENAERYDNGVWATIDECIAEAEAVGVARGDTIYVGECVNFAILIDSQNILEDLCEEAYDFAEASEEWGESIIRLSTQEVEELNKKLSQVVADFLVSRHLEPNFYQVDNIREVIVD